MPLVTAQARGQSNGDVVTEFVDTVGTTSTTWTYPKTQNKLRVKNNGRSNLTLTVGTYTNQTIVPGGVWENEVDFTSFTLVSASGTQQINVRATEIVPVTPFIKRAVATTTGKDWSTTEEKATITLDGKEELFLTAPMYDDQEVLLWGSSTMDSQGSTSEAASWRGRLNSYYSAAYGLTFQSRGVGGNTSQMILDRFGIDIAPDHQARFVVIGTTIGNEGFHDATDDAGRETVYKTIKANILKMANKVKDHGRIPIIVSQFPTQRYNAIHLQYANQLNHEMEAMGFYILDFMNSVLDQANPEAWPIASASADISHIDDTGQLAFAKSIPYIFDRLRIQPAGYLQSQRGYIHTGNLATDVPMTYTMTKGAAIESFTVSVMFKLSEAPGGGTSIFSFGTSGAERIFVNADGSLNMLRTGVGPSTVLGAAGTIAVGTWYRLTQSWNKIDGRLDVFLNGNNIYSGVDTGLTAFGTLNIGGRPAATFFLKNANIKDVIVYRTKKQTWQIKQLNDGIISQSALELYAPMNDKLTAGGTSLINMAMTPNNLRIVPAVTTITPVFVGPDL